MQLPDWKDPALSAEDKLAILEPHRLARVSATQMALLFVGASRMSIIGFMKRQKRQLLGPANNVAKPSPSERNKQATLHRIRVADERSPKVNPKATAPDMEFGILDDIPIEQRRTLMQLNEHTCKWPEGDPVKPGFHFCGGTPEQGSPYCATHDRRSKQY